jgi:hypothetical protein
MNQTKLLILSLWIVIFVPGHLSAQSRNHIYLQTGLFHIFFDGSPLMNIRYHNISKKPFNGLLINSLGVDYKRDFDSRNSLIIGGRSFRESYDKHFNAYPINDPIVFQRLFLTFYINYCRTAPISKSVSLTYGGGINFRHGSESIIITRGIISYFHEEPVYELLLVNLIKDDPGVNVFTGIDYTPVNWLTLSTKVDLLTAVRFNDKDGKAEMRDVYDSPQFPTRFDLSFNLGVGFNF